MPKAEEGEDLTKFDLNALLKEIQEVVDEMVRNSVTGKKAEKLAKLATDLKKKTGTRRCVRPAIAVRPIGKEVKGSRTRKLLEH